VSAMKKMHLNHDDMNVTIIGNFGVEQGSIDPQFQQTGVWFDYFSNDSIVVSDVNALINLEAGEYHIYTTKKLSVLGVSEIIYDKQSNIKIYPNPATRTVNIKIDEAFKGESIVSLYDIQGRLMLKEGINNSQTQLNIEGYKKGLYIVNVSVGSKTYVNKLMVN
jgi:hypothetical protein